MKLSIVSSYQFDEIPRSIGASKWIATDASCINEVGFLELMADARMLRDVAIGEMDVRECCLDLFVDEPPNRCHLRGISKAVALACDLALLVAAMDEIVASFTKCDEIVRAISARFARLDMMHIQDRVF